MKAIKFIHTADLHLDTPFYGLQDKLPNSIFERVKESSFLSLKRIIDLAIKENVDFILISGDLYDGENRSLKAQLKLCKELERLQEHSISAFIIHGNHDHLGGSWTTINWPENTVFFSSNVMVSSFQKANSTTHIYGFSYPRRSVKESMVDQYVKQEDADFHIGMLHGNLEGQVDHDSYAPFKLQQLLEKDFDYWALGHIHKRNILHERPYIIYPGNIQGRHSKELGEKGCFLIQLSEGEQEVEFVPTAEIIWKEETISIDQLHRVDELITKVETLKNEFRSTYSCGTFLSLELAGNGDLHSFLREEENISELLEVFRENEEDQTAFVWITKLKVHTLSEWNREQLVKESGFIGDLLFHMDEFQEYEEALAPLYKHRQAKKVLHALTEEEKKELLAEAEKILLENLLLE